MTLHRPFTKHGSVSYGELLNADMCRHAMQKSRVHEHHRQPIARDWEGVKLVVADNCFPRF